ncbi:MAG: helix-turn-helix domain-containing protein [Candidatus Eisenbacteria bacterium]|nr:helix-turn-helix domain-containing protein [Candidatus Eisenbacteria bacterium]
MRQTPLDLLMARTRQQLLSAILMHPDRWWYRSELAARFGVRPSTLQRPLGALVEAGILKTRRDGNRLYFQADADSPLYPELRGLVAKTAGLVDVLRGALSPLGTRIRVAFVFGSVARTEEASTSDIDLMVVGSVGLADLSLPLREAAAQLGREVNPTVCTPEEMVQRAGGRHQFITSVLDSPKLFVLGTEDALARLAQAKAGGEQTHSAD